MALFFLFMFDKEGKSFYAVNCLFRYVLIVYVELILETCLQILYSASFCKYLFFSSLYLLVLHLQYDKESTVEAKFKKLEKETSGSGSSMFSTLVNNTDLLACKAEYYHQCCEYQKCFELTSA